MLEHARSPMLSDADPAIRLPPAAVRAYLALVGGLGAAGTAILLLLSIAANSGNEAERIADAQGEGYARTLVGALAVNLSKPLR